MTSAAIVALVKYGLLALLWVFVLVALRTVRADLSGGGRAPRMPAAARPAAAAPPRAAAGAGGKRSKARSLVVTEGALAGTRVALAEAPITLGRADDSTLVLTDDYASTRHARLVLEGDVWVLEDLGSTNGTYLGSAKVTRPTPVPLGTPIRIGKTALELRR